MTSYADHTDRECGGAGDSSAGCGVDDGDGRGARGDKIRSWNLRCLDPVTGTLGISAFAGSEPDLLSISSGSKGIDVGLEGASDVQRLTLPQLTKDITMPLGSDSFDGPLLHPRLTGVLRP